MYGDFPARNTVCAPYIRISIWFWPILAMLYVVTVNIVALYVCTMVLCFNHNCHFTGSESLAVWRVRRPLFVGLTLIILNFLGLARTEYIYCIWPYIWWFICQNTVYTPYMYGSGQPNVYWLQLLFSTGSETLAIWRVRRPLLVGLTLLTFTGASRVGQDQMYMQCIIRICKPFIYGISGRESNKYTVYHMYMYGLGQPYVHAVYARHS
jgi:hypothetical protein